MMNRIVYNFMCLQAPTDPTFQQQSELNTYKQLKFLFIFMIQS